MGRPKAELRVGGTPILAYLLDRFSWEGPTLLVSAPGRQRPPGAERFTREVVDSVAGEGPLRGVITALEATETENLLVASCDMPLIEPRQLRWLGNTLADAVACPLIMLARAGGRLEPLPLAVRANAARDVRAHLLDGNRSLHSLVRLKGAQVATAPDERPESVWTNLNTPGDFERFLRQFNP